VQDGFTCEGGNGRDAFYDIIVEALYRAVDEHCSVITASYYKPYWDDELTDPKHKSIAAHDMIKAGPDRHQSIKPKDVQIQAYY